jgi:hypothetical protein
VLKGHTRTQYLLASLLTNLSEVTSFALAVVVQGHQGNEMYVILRGRLQVWEQTGKSGPLARLVHCLTRRNDRTAASLLKRVLCKSPQTKL